MSLFCRLGRHRARPQPRWNEGYYFTTCARCGRDLVRTPFEEWKVPVGYRVVWSDRPPENRPSAKLEPEPAWADDSPGAAADATRDGERQASEASGFDPTPARDSFASASRERTPEQTGGRAADLSIAEVLRILREEERLALEQSDPDAEPERAEPVEESEPRVLDLGELDPENLQVAIAEPVHSQMNEPGDVAKVELAPESETIAGDSSATPPPDTEPLEPAAPGPSPPSAPFEDFMDEPDRAADGTDFWITPADTAVAIDEATDADEALDNPPGVEGGRAFAWATAGEDHPRDHPAEIEQGLIISPPTAEELQLADDLSDSEETEERTQDEGRMAWPSAAPTQVHTPIIGMDGRVRTRDRNRSRMGLRIAIAALSLATVVIVTRGSGFETERPGAGIARDPAGLTATGRTEQFNASRAYVATRVLNCRASPALGARPLRKLARGEAVRMLAREPGWASIAHQGRQCWVADRYLSAEPPL